MSSLCLEARLALEWLNASGVRSSERLRSLVEHFCAVNGLSDPKTIEAIAAQARTAWLSRP